MFLFFLSETKITIQTSPAYELADKTAAGDIFKIKTFKITIVNKSVNITPSVPLKRG